MTNRPKEISTSEFKVLLKYWGDKKVQDSAKRNSNSRKELTETHTVGPKSFAQIKNKMVLEKPVVDDEEPPAPPSVSQIYVKTRKRDENREYKLPADQIKTKIAEINKVLDAGGSVEDADQKIPSLQVNVNDFLLEHPADNSSGSHNANP
ncbi:hypothetical protein POM88_020256 [Heracleum sosnowskyi]|uniref:Uncharacterized protein n=1 Tax=Heracleum sosnowskyi TaxID=360622 RepID=A0AAD8IBJ8_9APIA|nr:hypothetical protein POM88_020256 [Heracleum sosnowskyi]